MSKFWVRAVLAFLSGLFEGLAAVGAAVLLAFLVGLPPVAAIACGIVVVILLSILSSALGAEVRKP